MGTEIERKFLVTGTDWLYVDPREAESKLVGTHVSQGYLSLDEKRTVRVRQIGDKAFITIKGEMKGITRAEFEYEIPYSEAEQLLRMCGEAVIYKTRYVVMYKGMKWEIDWFLDKLAGLVIAEIELESPTQKFLFPNWIGEEVTHDPKYFNSNLASNLIKRMTPGENIALFDLDGSIADYEGAMARDLASIRGEFEPAYPVFMKERPDFLKKRADLIRKTPGWWENLPVLPGGLYVLEEALNLGYEVHVLTKGPNNADNAWTEKVRWCKKHLPEKVKITVTQDKGLVYGKVLFDDFPEYIERWLQWRPRGLVIMPTSDSNKGFTHPNVLRYDFNSVISRKLVRMALGQAMARKPGESLSCLPKSEILDEGEF